MSRPPLRQTHTVVHMEVSPAFYREVRQKLLEADYRHTMDDPGAGLDGTGPLDLTGIALVPAEPDPQVET